MILANSFHMLLVKKNVLPAFNHPISQRLFGQNKTYRGFILLPILSGLIILLESLIFGPFFCSYGTDFIFGLGLGTVYLLAELPNSFVKRRLHIPNGGHSEKYKVLQIIIDRADSLIGIFIYYYFVVSISILDSFILFLSAMIVSFFTSLLLNLLKIKRSI